MKDKRSLLDLFREQVRLGAHRPALREKRGGRWVTTSWGEWSDRSTSIASALLDLRVDEGARVAILGRTRQAWVETDLAVLAIGAATVPVYATLPGEQIVQILRDSGARVLFVDDPALADRVLAAGASLDELVVFEPRALLADGDAEGRRVVDVEDLRGRGGANVRTIDELVARGAERLGANRALLAAREAALGPASLASILYTSGTSGPPRGVILTHDNFLFEVDALFEVMKLGPHDEQLLLLPMAHVFARILAIAQLRAGFVTSFAESIPKSIENFAEINPTFFGAVPRVFENVREMAEARARQGGEWKRRLFEWAIETGRKAARMRRAGAPLPATLRVELAGADRAALAKIRGAFGTRLQFAISGGAPLSMDLAEWFDAAGVTILEGYGLTETTSATHLSRPSSRRLGSVGLPLPGVEVRLEGDGEILVRGRNVTRGYWNDPASTLDAIDGDGWLHTGDIGTIADDGSLSITDRKKDLIVTSGGKNVAPQNIEAKLSGSKLISGAVVFGDRRKFLVALVSLRKDAVHRWARQKDRDPDMTELARDPELRALVQEEIDRVNATLAPYESIRRFAILGRDLSPELGELTPTLKVRRRAVYERHRELVDALYDEGDAWQEDERAIS